MKEVWKPFPPRRGYEVSSRGRIRSLDRYLKLKTANGDITNRFHRGKILKLDRFHHDGYTRFTTKNGDRWLLNRAVCWSFNGPPPTNKHFAAHLDGCPQNNKPNNLSWVTAKENSSHRIIHGTMKVGEDNHMSKLKNNNIKIILHKYKSGLTMQKIADEFGMCINSIWNVIQGNTWRHIKIKRLPRIR